MRSLFFLLLIVLSSTGYSQSSVTATATVTILKPISITKEADLNFAEIMVNETSGTVILSPDGSRTVSGGAAFPTQSTHTAKAASFKINGEAASYSISLPEEILLSNGTHTLLLNNLTHDSAGTLENGVEKVNVGATLHINGMQKPGTYYNAGDLRMTVQYQ